MLLLLIIGGYGVSGTVATGLAMRQVRPAHEDVYHPAAMVVAALQRERLLSVQFLSGDASGHALRAQREETDGAIADFKRMASGDVLTVNEELPENVSAALSRLEKLADDRAVVDSGGTDRNAVLEAYTDVIHAMFPVYHSMPSEAPSSVVTAHQSMLAIQRAREVLSQEMALLAGVIAEGTMTVAERQQFSYLVGANRYLFNQVATDLPASEREAYHAAVESDAFGALRRLEDEVTKQPLTETYVPVSTSAWVPAAERALAAVAEFENDFSGYMLRIGDDAARASLVKAGLLILGGLVMVAGLMTVWARVAVGYIMRRLFELRDAADRMAHDVLPRVVDKLRRGETVDVMAEAPQLEAGPDEFGRVSRALNDAQRVAVTAAVEQARLRHAFRDVFVSLARRNQTLVHQQVRLLDEMERATSDPSELEKLFAVDHLATQMRRHAENLIILAGASAPRQWRAPVAMVDVLRSAIGEVRDYTRVSLEPVGDVAVVGRAVADVIPLVAALIDNAVAYSPPQTRVIVRGEEVPNGFVIEIEDRGLGMSREDLARYNERLASPPDFQLSGAVQLGFLVVAHLAHRHGIKVHLRPSPYGGVTAIVLIPSELLQPKVPGSETGPRAIEAGDSDDDTAELQAVTDVTPVPEPAPHRVALGARPATELRAITAGTASGSAASPSRTVEDARPADASAHPVSAPGVTDTQPRIPTVAPRPSPEPAQPVAAATSDGPAVAGTTPDGLPRRVRQASLARELRATTPGPADENTVSKTRTPEQIRAMMTAFQQASKRGRSDAQAGEVPMPRTPRPTPAPSDDAKREGT